MGLGRAPLDEEGRGHVEEALTQKNGARVRRAASEESVASASLGAMSTLVETLQAGALHITLTRPASALSKLEAPIHRLLGKELPPEVRAVYERADGLHYRCKDAGEGPSGYDATLVGLEGMFGGLSKGNFRAHKPLKSIDAFEDDVMAGQPFYEEFWSEEFELESKKDLQRLNVLKRQKLLVSLPGESAYLSIDLFDEKREYGLNLLEDARDIFPLDLSLPDFVQYFSKFGAARWYYAFLGKKAFADKNVDGPRELAASLAFFEERGAFIDDIHALRARMKKR